MDRDDPAYRGQADYSAPLLALYDPLVLGPILRFVWRFPSSLGVAQYREHVCDRHLDVGPGTGYFLARSGLPAGSRVTLLDPNRTVLGHAAGRLRHLDVTSVEADVLKPLPLDGPFQSAALAAVLHCLPGPAARKALAVANVASVLAPDGVLFGASVLGSSGRHTWVGRQVLKAFNRRGAFDNLDDSEDSIRAALLASFEHVEINVIGSIAMFVARRPRVSGSP